MGNSQIIIPLAIFFTISLLGIFCYLFIAKVLRPWSRDTGRKAVRLLVDANKSLIIPWSLVLGVFLAVRFSELAPDMKIQVNRGSLSILIFTMFWMASGLAVGYLKSKFDKLPEPAYRAFLTLTRIILSILAILLILGIWGAPTQPIAIIIVAIVFFAAVSLRDYVPNILAGIELVVNGHIKPNHLVKLESGEIGCVVRIWMTSTTLRTPEGNTIIVPNRRILAGKLYNYGENGPTTENRGNAPSTLLSLLTARELEVLRSIGSGATNREIAQVLILSEHTVKSHLRSILGKLNLRNRQQAAAFAEREGLVSEPGEPDKYSLLESNQD